MGEYIPYTPNYFAIDDILATQEKIPCKVLIDVPKMGKLNPATKTDDLKAGTSTELPFWLADQLALGRQPLISVDLPQIYKESYREILKADASVINLQKFNLYFYELGLHVKKFDVRGELTDTLLHTFQTRFRQLMDLTDNIGYNPSVQDPLDITEQKLFKDGQSAKAKLNIWLTDSHTPIEAASMVINHKKRKRIAIEDVI